MCPASSRENELRSRKKPSRYSPHFGRPYLYGVGCSWRGPSQPESRRHPGGNIRIESVLSEAVLDEVLAKVAADYFPHYALSAWVTDVEVLRDERY